MRKKIATIIAAVSMLAAFAVPAIASAAPNTQKTQVSGVITSGGNAVRRARVTVVCNGHARSTRTNNAGKYSVTFAAGQCPIGDTVTVVATKGDEGGVSAGKVTKGTVNMNVAIVNVSVPELGLATGIGATVAAGAGFMVIRRRQMARE